MRKDLKNIPTPTPPRRGGVQSETGIESVLEPSPSGRAGWGYVTGDKYLWKILQEKALEMKDDPTPAEVLLWDVLKDNTLGFHFRRQHVIHKFIVDFVCLKQKLVIEVDGDIHDTQQESDQERTEDLTARGFRVLRFKNEQILDDINTVIDRIKETLPCGEGLGGDKIVL